MKIILVLICIHFSLVNYAQESSFQPELLIGNRSAMFQHFLKLPVNKKLSITNNFLIDNEYSTSENRIFFFRNSLNYHFTKRWQVNSAVGLKNPGLFMTIAWTYSVITDQKTFSYTVGFTIQNEISFEQTLIYRRSLIEFRQYQLQSQIVIIANFDRSGYSRGIQQFRLGVQRASTQLGLGLNLDQFGNSSKTLFNTGVYLKQIIIKNNNL